MEGRISLHKDLVLDGMLVHRRVISDSKFAGTHFHTWVDRGTIVKFLSKNTTQCPWLRFKSGPLDPEPDALTIRPPHRIISGRCLIL